MTKLFGLKNKIHYLYKGIYYTRNTTKTAFLFGIILRCSCLLSIRKYIHLISDITLTFIFMRVSIRSLWK